jgi:protein-disulfide isomerase
MRPNVLTPLAILFAGAMIAGAMVFTAVFSVHEVLTEVRRSSDAQLAAYQAQLAAYQAQAQAQAAAAASAAQQQPQAAPPPDVDAARVATAGEPFIGSPDAPVTMAYWFDYQCPFCQRLEQLVMPSLINDYVTPGKLRIVFKDYAFLGPDSQTAVLAARAVWETAPDKFYAWHKAMFEHQDQENGGWGGQADIMALTKTIEGIDADKIAELMVSKAADYNQGIQNDGYEGSSMGVSGTPGSIVGKQLVVGAQPYGQFKAAVEMALTSAAAAAGTASESVPGSPPPVRAQ